MPYIFRILLVLCIATAHSSVAQEHYLHCVQTENNNSNHIFWSQQIIQSGFDSYAVYYKISGSPGDYALLTEISDYNTTDYIHNSVDPLTNIYRYFISTRLNNGDSIVSDTLNSMRLALFNDQGNASLNWNRPKSDLTHYDPNYKIYRQYSGDSWTLIATTLATNYVDSISVCYDTINYRIEMEENTGCSLISNVIGDWLFDQNQPDIPYLDSVSIQNGKIVLGWRESPEEDVIAYEIFKRFQGGPWTPLDTVFGKGNTFYEDTSSLACEGAWSYSLAAFDSCSNSSIFGIGPEQQGEFLNNIHFDTIIYDPCALENSLVWTPYINMRDGLLIYEVYASINGSAFSKIGETDISESVFIHTGIVPGSNYEYVIKAVSLNPDISSSSCLKSIATFASNRPDYNYLRRVSVDEAQTIVVEFYPDTFAIANGYRIFRSDQAGGPFAVIDTVYLQGELPIVFHDQSVNGGDRSWHYQVSVIDSCMQDYMLTQVHSSIHLTGQVISEEQIRLNWTPYLNWENGADNYIIMRRSSPADAWQIIANVNSSTFSYDDMLSDITESGVYYYKIEAFSNEYTSFNFVDLVYSNTIISRLSTRLYMPTAFKPGGITSTFKPIVNYVEEGKFLMLIFNRWGQRIAEIEDPNQGWDGKVNGKLVNAGTYVYLIEYEDEKSELKNVKGFFTVVY